jgi:hypothetical protein
MAPLISIHLAYVLAALLALGVQGLVLDFVWPYLAAGQFTDPDAYTWLGHVERLMENGSWYDRLQPRANWPYGEVQHSSRPFVAVLLAGTWVLTPILGSEAALFWWSALASPLFYFVLGAAVAWTASQFGRWQGPVAIVLLLTQYSVLTYAAPGRPDHHLLIMTAFVVVMRLTAHLLAERPQPRAAVVAGAVTAFGLWLSLEFILVLAASVAVLIWVWIRHGAERGGTGFWHSAGLVSGLALALVAEYPFTHLFVPHFDRISFVHLVMGGIAVAFWGLILGLQRLRGRRLTQTDRLLLGAIAGAMAVSGMALLYPDFFSGPTGMLDPRAYDLLVYVIAEARGLLPTDWLSLIWFLLYLWLVVATIPVLVLRVQYRRNAGGPDIWTYLALLLAVYFVASLSMRRFAPYAEIVAVIVMADALVRSGRWLIERARPRTATILAGTAAVVAVSAIGGNAYRAGTDVTFMPPCHADLKELAGFLNAEGERERRQFTIVAMPDLGPELLYRTPHRVIGTPSISNEAGAIAIFEIFNSADDQSAMAVIAERGIDHVLTCPSLELSWPAGFRALDTRLSARETPSWLRHVRLPGYLGGAYELYRVERDLPVRQP